ncbi:MAG: type II secretion system protein [Tepidisphaeraceae bacterium]
MTRINRKRGFTLVEILIVVIILGILAAIVIPQFTNASTDAKNSSAKSMLQTLRSQVELFKLQHGDRWPVAAADGILVDATTFDWTKLTSKTELDGNTTIDSSGNEVGPYMQSPSVNPHLLGSNVQIVVDDATAKAATPATGATVALTDGWVMSATTGKIWAFEPSNNPEGDVDTVINE